MDTDDPYRVMTAETMFVKRETLVAYQDRLNTCLKVIHTALNGMTIENPLYERTIALFQQGKEFSDVLFGDDIAGNTMELSNRLQSFELRVLRYKKGLPDDVREELESEIAEQSEDAPVPAAQIVSDVATLDTDVGKDAALKFHDAAKVLMQKSVNAVCSVHPALRLLPEVKRMNDLISQWEQCKRELIKVPL
jgi:hypothetical protein